jgi:ribonuclease E
MSDDGSDGAESGDEPDTEDAASDPQDIPATVGAESAETAGSGDEAPAKPARKRSRSRKPKATEGTEAAVEAVAEAKASEPVVAEAPPEVTAEHTAGEQPAEPEAKPKRARKPRAPKVAEASQPETPAAPAPVALPDLQPDPQDATAGAVTEATGLQANPGLSDGAAASDVDAEVIQSDAPAVQQAPATDTPAQEDGAQEAKPRRRGWWNLGR